MTALLFYVKLHSMFDKITKTSLLHDFYGQLLTDRQQQVMKLYHEENLSLSEIAREFGISRQGVHDTLKSAEKTLTGYETKLGLVEKFKKTEGAVKEIDDIIDRIISENNIDKASKNKLNNIKKIIDEINE